MLNTSLYQKLIKKVSESPGVYLMRGTKRKILYIGKAGNLKRRVSSYFLRPLEYRLKKMVSEISKIDFKRTDTALEALILESQLIKKHRPPYNVREKDDRSFLYIEITRDEFPRVLLVRGKDLKKGAVYYGPFVEAGSLKEALRLIRKMFQFNIHSPDEIKKMRESENRPCFNWQIGLCPGTCAGAITKQEYAKTIRNIKLIFEGRKRKLLGTLEKEMKIAAEKQEFEIAEKKKRQLFALRHINDVALISDEAQQIANSPSASLRSGKSQILRIEGYDISNISGTNAVGSMVVFQNGKPSKSDYRKFKIRYIFDSNAKPRTEFRSGGGDVGMLKEVLRRRLKHGEWLLPNLFLIDGGKPQVNAVKEVLLRFSVKIPVVGIAKGPTRHKNELIGDLYEVRPYKISKNTLIQVRDEAHRFAISYHRKLRGQL